MTDIEPLRATFIDTLTAGGYLRDEKWLAAFHNVPRGPFVPYYFTQMSDHSGWMLAESPSTRWAEGVYSNNPLITQLDGDDTLTETARRGQVVNGVSTSSSSAPSLMALMLDALDVHDGETILEIGTGTGYTALLCHRAGADQVTSVDIDPGLVRAARQRLATFGYRPHLATLDGTAGCAARAPFDRVIATVAVPSVPQEWITQTRAGGVILLPLDRRNCGGLLAKLTVQPGGIAQGRFLSDFGGFIPVRPLHRPDAADHAFRTIDNGDGDTRHTLLPAHVITQEASPVEFFAALTVPGCGWNSLTFTPDNGGPTETWLAQGDGSWVCHTTAADGTHTVPVKADPLASGTRWKPPTINGTRSANPPATDSASPSTTDDTPSGSTIRTAHTGGHYRHPPDSVCYAKESEWNSVRLSAPVMHSNSQ